MENCMKQLRSYALALAIAVIATPTFAADTLRFCTGGEGGFYESLGQAIGTAITKKTGSGLEILNTGGSVENAELLKDGDCDIGILQADVVSTASLPADIKVVDAHTEVVYWLHPKNGAVDDFGDMEQDAIAAKYAFAAVSGSGALTTVRNWIKTDKDYEGARVIEFDDWYGAAEAVAQGYVTKAGVRIEIAGMLYIGRPGKISGDITEDFGNQIVIGEVNDDSFAASKDVNGNPLYVHCAIDSAATSGLKTSSTLSPDTYCLKAQVVYNNAYHASLPAKEQRAVRRAIDKGINSVVKAVR
jgi:hypothetical protein